MTGVKRLRDWTALSPGERAAAAATCRRRAGSLGLRLNAVATMLPETGMMGGPLAGLPYVAKDLFATCVHTPSNGLASNAKREVPRAEVLVRLDRAGARLIAAAEMTALAYEPSGYNAARGRVLNPWDFDAVAGGSSSGSAALVAAGCAFAALGSDTGGSVRIPANCCGVTSIKPTPSAIPTAGAMPLAPSLDTIGLFARSARDLMLLWPVVSGQMRQPVGIKSAVRLATFFERSVPDVRAACNAAADFIARLGVRVSSANEFPDDADKHAQTVLQAEAAQIHRVISDDGDPQLHKRLAKGLDIPKSDVDACLAERDRLRGQFLDAFGDVDVALTPVMPIAVPDAAETDPTSEHFRPRTLYGLSAFTRFVNFLGLPAMSVPVGFDRRGRPVGLQIIGRPQQDMQLLALAASFQNATDWHDRTPTAVAGEMTKEGDAAA